MKLEDLSEGMELRGSVLNVVDFGAFVDIGLSDSGLVHVSRMSHQYVRDPHSLVAVGDQVRVWVAAIDKQRRRVSLSMIDPTAEPPTARGTRRRSGSSASAAARSSPRRSRRSGRGGRRRRRRTTRTRSARSARGRPSSASARCSG